MSQATVIIAAWQAEETLAKSVNSALAQGAVVGEIVVVDDASADGTAAVAERAAAQDPRVKLVRLAQNSGPAAARNAALDIARNDWIVVLDADDTMMPGRLLRMIAFAEDKSADIVVDGITFTSPHGQVQSTPELAFPGTPSRAAWGVTDYICGNRLHKDRLSLGFLKPIFRRSFIEENRLRYDESLRNGEDFHFVLAALTQNAKLWFLEEPGYLYTKRAGSISNRLNLDHARALERADRNYLNGPGACLGHDVKKQMKKRIAEYANLAATEAALQAFKSGRFLAGFLALTRRPQAVRRFLTQLSEAVRGRLIRQ